MRSLYYIIFSVFLATRVLSQDPFHNPYDPQQMTEQDWKFAGKLYFSDAANSNNFTNDFFKKVNRSDFLDDEMKDTQLGLISDNTVTGSIREIGGALYFKNKNKFYYAGLEHQHVLDTKLDEDLLRLLLLGNQPFAGKTLSAPSSHYYNIYFMQLKLGMGFIFKQHDFTQTLSMHVDINAGQNYDEINVKNSTFTTSAEGDYLDVALHADTRLSDTVWSELSTVNGWGFSGGIFYSISKERNFYIAAEVKNLGSIRWNKNPYTATVDTSFVFNGLEMDTAQATQNNLPDDFSYENLRRIAFKNPDGSPFSSALPLIVNFTGGKYFSEGRYYLGINTHFYPGLHAVYQLELFITMHVKNILAITPIAGYGSYGKLNYGLSFQIKAGNHVYIQAGSAYLNSLFSGNAPVGSGGYAGIVFKR